MSLATLDERTGVLGRRNALAKLVAATVVGVPLLLSIDPVSAAVALAAVLVLLPFARLSARGLWLRLWPIVVSALIAAAATVLYGRAGGETYLQWGLVHVSDGSLLLAAAIALRVLAIAVPSVVLFATTDPTDLADALAQLAKLPARFVIGALAGMRLVGLLIDDWNELARARRARGIADNGRVRRFLGQAFAVFVLAIRRGSDLATAMEARGFDAPVTRTWARTSRLTAGDAVLVLLGLAVAAASVGIALVTGSWRFVLTL
ncbi:MAG: ABC transporter [Microbacterium sp. SCN 71-21]|jgi:energy-coupling factor transport system permease protein|uniref:energy-coupling factor transporter transmembrane component T family protein n=1 Tax=Microbacterium sp. SCN 71-21 TaxID=1660116 RepID=UPI00086F74BD|nr:energy-coupling factor transporter transmembrane component T [Microbacterium sp. SCN 71-21]ODU77606.1 MAG: ABC transporter [Microbacterium sp. SCN 71-21]